jgi:hypothetical protein
MRARGDSDCTRKQGASVVNRLGIICASAMLLVTGTAAAAPPAGWALIEDKAAGKPCTAAHQPQAAPGNHFANTRLLRNNRNHMILIAARGDWDVSGSRTISLAIDQGEPVSLEAQGVGPLILTEIADAALERKLRDASTLTWILPTDRYTADVTGLGAAFDLVASCSN